MLQNISLFAIARLYNGLPIIHHYWTIFDEFFNVTLTDVSSPGKPIFRSNVNRRITVVNSLSIYTKFMTFCSNSKL